MWRYVYRAVDEHGQGSDVLVSRRRNIAAARRFFIAAIDAHGEPNEVVTDRAAALAYVVAEQIPAAMHNTAQYANNRIECDYGRLKARLQPMLGLKIDRTATSSSAVTPSYRIFGEATTYSVSKHDAISYA